MNGGGAQMSDENNMNDYHLLFNNNNDDDDCHCHDHPLILTKVPVVLAEVDVQIHLDALIKFPAPVLEIKDIKKSIKLTQCRLLLPTKKLFVKGFVRKNIQYASPCKNNIDYRKKSISSNLLSLTVDIPFQSVTEIKDFLAKPDIPLVNMRNEFDFLVSKHLPNGCQKNKELQTTDLSQFHQESTQFYNELPYCELISSNIIEWDEAIDRCPLPYHLGEGTFTKMEEKMVVDLIIKVLQKQQVQIFHSKAHEDKHDCDY
ncbi:DUF3794 domain-containing protein [Cytobacillus praedii]|uniref:DUF3794 domain-containing protein n=2 Tax=Cytobacillus praedii TaxID=1742358 RepID=A0A4R1ATT9_9BACI|nr:DUF3794 domain-containing protein [Cytobacillus praedii]